MMPDDKPNNGYAQTNDSKSVAHITQTERLLRDEEPRGADGGHEQGGNERHPEALPLAQQIDGKRPQCEYRECLVRPAEVLPDGVEAIGILNLPDKHRNGAKEHRNADHEALRDGTLVEFQPLSHDETA